MVVGAMFTNRLLPKREFVRPVPTPIPELLSLPRIAKTMCRRDSNLNMPYIFLWEKPGTGPVDDSNQYKGDNGKTTGRLGPCTAIEVTKYAWSDADSYYYVYAKKESIAGWTPIAHITFSEFSN